MNSLNYIVHNKLPSSYCSPKHRYFPFQEPFSISLKSEARNRRKNITKYFYLRKSEPVKNDTIVSEPTKRELKINQDNNMNSLAPIKSVDNSS